MKVKNDLVNVEGRLEVALEAAGRMIVWLLCTKGLAGRNQEHCTDCGSVLATKQLFLGAVVIICTATDTYCGTSYYYKQSPQSNIHQMSQTK